MKSVYGSLHCSFVHNSCRQELSSAAKVGPVNALLQAYVEGLRSPHLVWWDWSAKFRKPNGSFGLLVELLLEDVSVAQVD